MLKNVEANSPAAFTPPASTRMQEQSGRPFKVPLFMFSPVPLFSPKVNLACQADQEEPGTKCAIKASNEMTNGNTKLPCKPTLCKHLPHLAKRKVRSPSVR